MSKRDPMSYFTLDEKPEVIAEKISDAQVECQPQMNRESLVQIQTSVQS